MIAKKKDNYAVWYLQQRAADQLTQAVAACQDADFDSAEISLLVETIHDLGWWFDLHGLGEGAYDRWVERVRQAMR